MVDDESGSEYLDSKYGDGWVSVVCSFCKHETDLHRCEAFPDGIPPDIWLGKNNHKKPFPGDNGIQFEPIEK